MSHKIKIIHTFFSYSYSFIVALFCCFACANCWVSSQNLAIADFFLAGYVRQNLNYKLSCGNFWCCLQHFVPFRENVSMFARRDFWGTTSCYRLFFARLFCSTRNVNCVEQNCWNCAIVLMFFSVVWTGKLWRVTLNLWTWLWDTKCMIVDNVC